MKRRIVSLILAAILIMSVLPAGVIAEEATHTITPFGNEFEINTPEEWATGDLDGGKLVVDSVAGGGAIKLAEDETEVVYTSQEITMGKAFEYLVMSWNADAPEGTWVEVTASVWLDKHEVWSGYATWGRWGPFIKRASHASYSQDELPYINISSDELYVRGNPNEGDTASKVRLRVILHRDDASLDSPVLWFLHGTTRTTGVSPEKVFRDGLGEIADYTCEVEVPQYSQMVRAPVIGGVICNPTTTAMLLNSVSQREGAGLSLLPEEVAMGCYDFRNNSFGNWSFAMAAAGSYGYQSYVDYSTIEGIKRHLKSGYAVGASVAYSTDPNADNYLEGAYGSTPGHLIVLRGFTVEDGVEYFISNDAFNPTNTAVRKLYKVDQFEKVWSRNTIYIIKPDKIASVGNHPAKRVWADLEEVETYKYALKLDVFGTSTPIQTPEKNSVYSDRHGFIGYITDPEVFTGEDTSVYSYISVAANDSDLLTLSDEILEDGNFKLYLANNDAHTGRMFIVDKDSDIKYLVSTTVISPDYTVTANEISPNEKAIIFGETTAQEFLDGLTARHAAIKLFASGTTVEDAGSFNSTSPKTEGTLADGDFLGVLALDDATFHRYDIKAGAALLPLNLSFELDTVSLYHIDFPCTNALTGYQGSGAVAYASSNTTVARVDEKNGQVTPWNVGNDVIITVSVDSDGVYQAATASYTLSVLRGTISGFHWGTIAHPKVGEVPSKTYTPSTEDQPDLFYFATNEPRFTWTGTLEDGKFKAGEAYSVEVRLQSNDYPGGNSAYFYANPFTADMIIDCPAVGDGAVYSEITEVTVTRNNNYRLTAKIGYSALRSKGVLGYYENPECTRTLTTDVSVENGTEKANALAMLPVFGYAKVSDGSVVAIDIAWAFDSIYLPAQAGIYPLTATATAHDGTGLENAHLPQLVGSVTVRRFYSPVDPTVQPAIRAFAVPIEGGARATIPDSQVSAALTAALEAVSVEGIAEVTIQVDARESTGRVDVVLSEAAIAALAQDSRTALTISTGVASFTLDHEALATLAIQSDGAEQMIFRTEIVDIVKEGLTEEAQDVVGDATVRRIMLCIGKAEVTAFPGVVEIVIPYDPAPGEDTGALTILSFDASGIRKLDDSRHDGKQGGFVGTVSGSSGFFLAKNVAKLVTDYDDVKKADWYYPGVKFVTESGLMNGLAGDHFGPSGDMTRAMLIATLYRYAGSPEVDGKSSFGDVLETQWYTDAVVWAESQGIIQGYGNGLFGTHDRVTRQELATILYRFTTKRGANVSAAAELASYSDAAEVAEWAEAAMKWAVAEGIVEGRSETELVPRASACRAEAATMLMRYAGLGE